MTQTMTEDEARAILAEVEPPLAAYEREQSRLLRSEELGDMIPRVRVQHAAVDYDDWRPSATRTPSGWAISGGWLDAPVPPLPTRGVPNAGGVSPMMVDPEHNDGAESVWDRHRSAPVFLPRFTREAPYSTSEVLAVLRRRAERYDVADGVVCATASAWHRNRAATRGAPTLDVARGWCNGLDAGLRAERQPATKAGWAVMVRALRAFMRTTDAAWAAERAELTQRTEAA